MSKLVVLKPGEFFFGGDGETLRTLLGSCVAITLWHPKKRIGGMCHFLLPSNPCRQSADLDGRYGDDAMALFLRHIKRRGTQPGEYQVKLFGGGNMFPRLSQEGGDVGRKNIAAARQMLENNRFRVVAEHVGNAGHRTVLLELGSGQTWVRWQA